MHHILLAAPGSDGDGRQVPKTAEPGYAGYQAHLSCGQYSCPVPTKKPAASLSLAACPAALESIQMILFLNICPSLLTGMIFFRCATNTRPAMLFGEMPCFWITSFVVRQIRSQSTSGSCSVHSGYS